LSPDVFQTVVARHTSLTADQFVRVRIREKEYEADAWLRTLPGSSASTDKPGKQRRPPVADNTDSSHPPTDAESPPSSMRNDFHSPVNAEVIGWNFGSVNKGQL
jgi:hypothetical protein